MTAVDNCACGSARSATSGVSFSLAFSLSNVREVQYFVARREELDEMHKILGNGTGRRTVVVHGLGGMGKTQLAVAYAKRHRDEYSAIFWLDARDEASLKQGYAQITRRILAKHPPIASLRTALGSEDLDETVRAVRQWLDNPKNNRWLIIYDNYDNPALGEVGRGKERQGDGSAEVAIKPYDIRPFLPETHHGAVLITTRSSRVELGHAIPLRKLADVKDSLDILFHTSGRPEALEGKPKRYLCTRSKQKPMANSQPTLIDPAAVRLVEKLDGLPLALSTAGTYLKNMATSFGEYLDMYESSWIRLQTSTPALLTYENRALYSTWNLTCAQVRQQNKNSATLLLLWACFDHQDLWFELLQRGRGFALPWFRELTEDKLTFNEAVRVLCDYGLVEPDVSSRGRAGESGGYSMHGCVHDWTRHLLNKFGGERLSFVAMECVAASVPKKSTDFWLARRRLVRHAERCMARILYLSDGVEVTGDEWVAYTWFLSRVRPLFTFHDRVDDAEVLCRRALQGCERTLGNEHPCTLTATINLADIYENKGQLLAAESLCQRALDGCLQSLGQDHASTVSMLDQLGSLYFRQGRLSDAEAVMKRVLGIRERELGYGNLSTLETADRLGEIYTEQGRLSDAEAILKLSLEWKERTLADADDSPLNTLRSLANVYHEQNRFSEAKAMYERALEGYKKAVGPEQVDHCLPALFTMGKLASLYCEQGKLPEARRLCMRCKSGLAAVVGTRGKVYAAAERDLEAISSRC
jgi:tetratricopeptide (TPR) repeat protein